MKIFQQQFFRFLLLICLQQFFVQITIAEPLIVMDVRGFKAKVGSTIDSEKPLQLEEGDRITLIRSDGVAVTLRGPYNQPPMPKKSSQTDPKIALAALVTTRDARTNSVGTIRAGKDARPLPSPWLIDVTRPGIRCLQQDTQPVFWRPESDREVAFKIIPADRSYQVDTMWPAKEMYFKSDKIQFLNAQQYLTVTIEEEDFNIQISEIPKEIPEGLLLTGWMIEKGCVQQADALIKQLQDVK
jgi:hypothetical protein